MRSDAREAAFKIVYSELFHEDRDPALKRSLYKKYELNEDDVSYADRLIRTVEEKKEELLAKMDSIVMSYTLNRIFAVDKSILLVAMAEILYFDDIPNVVSVNEAAGLAKKFSSETSSDFVNGVLATLINP
ncbi:MAG: transcription antitermination factor NusB [Christensenellaceae bacterium]